MTQEQDTAPIGEGTSAGTAHGELRVELTLHQTNECNRNIRIRRVVDDSGVVLGYDVVISGEFVSWIPWQHGPIKEVGTNGLTLEAVFAIAIDQLELHQRSKYACAENVSALAHACEALGALKLRTLRRVEQGIEGTHEVDPK